MTIIDLAQRRREKSWECAVDSIADELSLMFNHADELVGEFVELLGHDPKSALQSINEFIDRSRNYKPNARVYEAMTGGPHEGLTAPFFRVTGTIYPSLDKEDRLIALQQCLAFLDGLNYTYSQNHVECIDEPWLAGDIINNRSIYSPGFEEYTILLRENKSWNELAEAFGKVKSKFWLGMAVSRVEYVSLDVRVKFRENLPTVVDRTQDTIAWRTHTWGLITQHREESSYDDYVDERINKYDPEWHDAIRQKMTEENAVLVHDCDLYGTIPELRVV